MACDSDEVIDLSDSYVLADHRALTNAVIELDSDDSVILDDSTIGLSSSDSSTSWNIHSTQHKRKNNPAAYLQQKQKVVINTQKIINKLVAKEMRAKFGECPICFDALGQNPLASTKCGHIYCKKCLEQYLLVDQRCPTCRQNLKGKSSYHPLYLNR